MLCSLEAKTKIVGDIPVYIYPVKTSLPKELTYMNEVILQTLEDHIRLQKKIYLKEERVFKKIRLQRVEDEDDRKTTSWERKTKELHINLETFKLKNMIIMRVTIKNSSLVLFQKNYSYSKNMLYKRLEKFGRAVRKFLCSDQCSVLSVLSKPWGASVYINDVYLGRSPLKVEYLNPNQYEIEFFKNDFEKKLKKIILAPQKHSFLKAELLRKEGKGSLSIETIPSNAFVYFNVGYQGKSPLNIKDLSEGTYRLNVRKKGFHEEQKTVTIENKKETKIKLTLAPVAEQRPPPNQFWGQLTHEHMYIGSFAASILSFSTGVYFSVEASKAKERTLASLGGRSADSYTQVDLDLISESKKQVDNRRRTAVIFYATGGAFLGLSFYFFLKNLRSQGDYKSKNGLTFWLYPQYDPFKKKNSLDWHFHYTCLLR